MIHIPQNQVRANKPKILIFSLAYDPFWGGAEIAVKEITKRLQNNYDFHLITLRFNSEWKKEEEIGGVKIFRVDGGKLLFPFGAFLQARRLNKKNNYNIVWSIMANRAGFAALFFKLFFPKTKFLLTLQEGDELSHPQKRAGVLWFFVKPLFKKIFTTADYIQAISNYLADWAKNFSVSKEKIEIVPNGVDVNNLSAEGGSASGGKSKEELKNRLKIQDDEKVIITTSRLVLKNGIKDLIEAMRLLPENVKLLVLGKGELEEKLKKQVENLNLQKKVLFLGEVVYEEVSQYLALADIFVRPSLSEGLGSSFLEAMAAGLPIIGTEVGGIPDFLKNYETGLFCKPNNPQSIADKVTELLENDELKQKIAQNGQKLVFKKYSWNLVAEKIQTIFQKLIN